MHLSRDYRLKVGTGERQETFLVCNITVESDKIASSRLVLHL